MRRYHHSCGGAWCLSALPPIPASIPCAERVTFNSAIPEGREWWIHGVGFSGAADRKFKGFLTGRMGMRSCAADMVSRRLKRKKSFNFFEKTMNLNKDTWDPPTLAPKRNSAHRMASEARVLVFLPVLFLQDLAQCRHPLFC